MAKKSGRKINDLYIAIDYRDNNNVCIFDEYMLEDAENLVSMLLNELVLDNSENITIYRLADRRVIKKSHNIVLEDEEYD